MRGEGAGHCFRYRRPLAGRIISPAPRSAAIIELGLGPRALEHKMTFRTIIWATASLHRALNDSATRADEAPHSSSSRRQLLPISADARYCCRDDAEAEEADFRA